MKSRNDDKKMSNEKQYLVWFGHNNSYFAQRFRELESLARMYGVARSDLYVGATPTSLDTEPYAIIRLPSEEVALKICKQAVLIKVIIELWGSGSTDAEVVSSVKVMVPEDMWNSYLGGKTFSYKVIGYGIQHTEEARRDRMAAFGSLFNGTEKVNIRSPSQVLYIIDEHERNFEQTGTRDESIPASKKRTFYGRQVAVADSSFRNRFVLTERPVLGPTSLDNDLAFLMSNMAEIETGKFVFDPFCGTGGLLIAATANGGIVQVGTDIDVRVLRGEFVAYAHIKTRDDMGTNIFENFKHYSLPLPEIVAADNGHHCWRTAMPLFDVILTDPPYGVRAGAKKIGAKYTHEIGNRDTYYPQMLGYLPEEVNGDLLSVASGLLVDGGVLVFLLHIELIELFTQDELSKLPKGEKNVGRGTKLLHQESCKRDYVYANECARDRNFLDEQILRERVIPTHPDMETESAVLQILSAGTGRVLVKMRRKPRI